jgi:hypothetical protein
MRRPCGSGRLRVAGRGCASTTASPGGCGYDTGVEMTYGGDLVSTWSVLRLSCEPRSPVGLVNPPGNTQMRNLLNSHTLPSH